MARRRATIDSLRTQMSNNLVLAENGRNFIPDQILAIIFSATAIENAVGELECHPSDRINLAKDILQQGRKLFALLVWINEAECIVDFRGHQTLDRSLPLRHELAQQIAPMIGARLVADQWIFLAFDFPRDMDTFHRKIKENQILPYVHQPEQVVDGFSSYVDKVEIHASQQGIFPLEVSPKPVLEDHGWQLYIELYNDNM